MKQACRRSGSSAEQREIQGVRTAVDDAHRHAPVLLVHVARRELDRRIRIARGGARAHVQHALRTRGSSSSVRCMSVPVPPPETIIDTGVEEMLTWVDGP